MDRAIQELDDCKLGRVIFNELKAFRKEYSDNHLEQEICLTNMTNRLTNLESQTERHKKEWMGEHKKMNIIIEDHDKVLFKSNGKPSIISQLITIHTDIKDIKKAKKDVKAVWTTIAVRTGLFVGLGIIGWIGAEILNHLKGIC